MSHGKRKSSGTWKEEVEVGHGKRRGGETCKEEEEVGHGKRKRRWDIERGRFLSEPWKEEE